MQTRGKWDYANKHQFSRTKFNKLLKDTNYNPHSFSIASEISLDALNRIILGITKNPSAKTIDRIMDTLELENVHDIMENY
jgi:predicted transcriptional regulator